MPAQGASTTDGFTIFARLLAVRLVNAITVKTFFQPDEYYQALEPAWNFAFGSRSSAWMTWEWTQHLRSAIHPAVFSIVYYIAGLCLRLTNNTDLQDGLLLQAPKVVQAIVAALGDYYTWKLAVKVYGKSPVSLTALALTILNPWQWFCSTRTFSNVFESSLTVAAIYYWPFRWPTRRLRSEPKRTGGAAKAELANRTHEISDFISNLRISLVLAATATIIRPTNILIWVVLVCFVLVGSNPQPATDNKKQETIDDRLGDSISSRIFLLAREGIFCGGLVFAISVLTDRAFYGVWTLPALNFLYFNVVQSLAVFYGNNDWHYYLSQGYPLMLTTALPFAIIGLFTITRNTSPLHQASPLERHILKQLAVVCLVLPSTLSVLSHKEVRFIYPILGPLHVIAAAPAWDFFSSLFSSSNPSQQAKPQKSPLKALLLAILTLLNILIAGYTSLTHSSGIIALPEYIRNEFKAHYAVPPTSSSKAKPNTLPQPQNLTLGILMPCHSIPWRSHFLNPPTQSQPGIQAWALTCEPPLHITNHTLKSTYLDEADIFYANPQAWLRKHMSRHAPVTPGLYTAPQRNKVLWSSSDADLATGLDITDLLPHLRTAPNNPPDPKPPRRPWPDYLAFFAQLETTLVSALDGVGYVECWRSFNTAWHDDWRRQGDVVVWCLFPERAVGRRGSEQMKVEERGRSEREENSDRVVPARTGTQRIVRPWDVDL